MNVQRISRFRRGSHSADTVPTRSAPAIRPSVPGMLLLAGLWVGSTAAADPNAKPLNTTLPAPTAAALAADPLAGAPTAAPTAPELSATETAAESVISEVLATQPDRGLAPSDNMQYRFNMQDGEQDAETFRAWMEAHGVRIAGGAPDPEEATDAATEAPAEASQPAVVAAANPDSTNQGTQPVVESAPAVLDAHTGAAVTAPGPQCQKTPPDC